MLHENGQGEIYVKTAAAAVNHSLTATRGSPRALLTHGPPMERAHEREDAVLGAAGGLGPENSGGQSQS